ncbi:hypothetical protein PR048_032975 [Dryococelus australis]|uniref:Uncharacterized protein n=1 Tax=Dryococelus australis TaxID=614101 RepID=A0ABQ9G3S2_9NEOP|nr:hypothetical protein PR048_032975 [Dryococelus australis]
MWPLAMFYYILAMCGANAYVLYNMYSKAEKLARYEFSKLDVFQVYSRQNYDLRVKAAVARLSNTSSRSKYGWFRKIAIIDYMKISPPRCFKIVKTKLVEYVVNRKTWMTCELFEKWLVKLDKKICTVHKSIPVLENESVFPTTHDLLFSQWIRVRLVENILAANEDKKIKINLQAFRMCNCAWEKVTVKQLQIVSTKQDLHSEDTIMTSKIKIKKIMTKSCQLWRFLET